MRKKLDNLSADIISLLEKREPDRLRWIEICQELWPLYRFKYKDEKVFGSAISPRLNKLVKDDIIKKKDSYYGTKDSKPPSKKPPKLGFLDRLERRAERKRRECELKASESDRKIRELEVERAMIREEAHMPRNQFNKFFIDADMQAETEQKWRKRYRLE